jgi:hypothetical protein
VNGVPLMMILGPNDCFELNMSDGCASGFIYESDSFFEFVGTSGLERVDFEG